MSAHLKDVELVRGLINVDAQYEFFESCRFIECVINVMAPPNYAPVFAFCHFVRCTIKSDDRNLFLDCLFEDCPSNEDTNDG